MTTFVKQYGLERTGTNAVRALLEAYAPGVTVLMHVLGDKHSPPVDLSRLLRATEPWHDRPLVFVAAASAMAPAETTDLRGDARQRRYLESVAPALFEETRAGRLRIVVTVREPYDWSSAMLRWLSRNPGWFPTSARDGDTATTVAELCERYNRFNRAWLELVERSPERAALVRHEELAGDLDALVARLAHELRLPATRPGARLPYTLAEAHWDHEATPAYAERDEERRRRLAGQEALPEPLAAVVDETIDWELAARLDFSPRRGSIR